MAKDELALNQPFRHEGVLGTVYTGELLREVQVGSYQAVVPTIGGLASAKCRCSIRMGTNRGEKTVP